MHGVPIGSSSNIIWAGPAAVNLGRFLFCSLGRVWFTPGGGVTYFDVYPTDAPDAFGKKNWVASATGGTLNNLISVNCF